MCRAEGETCSVIVNKIIRKNGCVEILRDGLILSPGDKIVTEEFEPIRSTRRIVCSNCGSTRLYEST